MNFKVTKITADENIKKQNGKEKYTVRSIQKDLFCGKTKSFEILKLIRETYPESIKKERIGRSTTTTIDKETYRTFITNYRLNKTKKEAEKKLLKIQNMSRKQLENLCLELCIQIENPILIDINNESYILESIKYAKTPLKTKIPQPQQVAINTKPPKKTPLTSNPTTMNSILKPNPEIDALKKIIKKYIK